MTNKSIQFQQFRNHRLELGFKSFKIGCFCGKPKHIIQADELIDYVLFMRAQKVRVMPQRIQVHVESAYAYDPKVPPFSMVKPQSFFKKLAAGIKKSPILQSF